MYPFCLLPELGRKWFLIWTHPIWSRWGLSKLSENLMTLQNSTYGPFRTLNLGITCVHASSTLYVCHTLMKLTHNYASSRERKSTVQNVFIVFSSNRYVFFSGCTVPINKKFQFHLRKTHHLHLNALKNTQNERIALCRNASVLTHAQ